MGRIRKKERRCVLDRPRVTNFSLAPSAEAMADAPPSCKKLSTQNQYLIKEPECFPFSFHRWDIPYKLKYSSVVLVNSTSAKVAAPSSPIQLAESEEERIVNAQERLRCFKDVLVLT